MGQKLVYVVLTLGIMACTASFANAKPRCFCPLIYSPVCGSNGITYSNECELECAEENVTFLHEGECTARVPCACTKIYQPVCASNGKTFGNVCEFKCAQRKNPDLSIRSKGRCRTSIFY